MEVQVGSYLHSAEPSEGDSAGDMYLDILNRTGALKTKTADEITKE